MSNRASLAVPAAIFLRREQFLDRKRLGKIVIRPRIQPINTVIDTSERRQNKDRDGVFAAAKRSHQVQPFAIGKTAIQNQNIVRAVTRESIGIADGAHVIGKHIPPAQRLKKRACHFGFILKKQDSQ